MNSSPPDEKRVQVAFEVFCKKVVSMELLKCKRDTLRNKAKKDNEISFSDITDEITVNDDYFTEYFFFQAAGEEFVVKNGSIANALSILPQQQIEIILLSYYLDISDAEIGKRLDMIKSKVQYHRTAALKKLKKEMEKYHYEKN
jgi:RNA polymerase sigma factor (sigma-70 family)